jgi:hypothetical protein
MTGFAYMKPLLAENFAHNHPHGPRIVDHQSVQHAKTPCAFSFPAS